MSSTPAGFIHRIVLAAAAVLWRVVAIARASCSVSIDRDDIVSFRLPSFRGVTNGGSRFDLSRDAGVLDGALHLTTDDFYQPPVTYPPDARHSAGRIMFWRGIRQALRSSDGNPPQEASFNTTFTMSVTWPRDQAAAAERDGSGLLLEVLPGVENGYDRAIYFSMATTTSGNVSVELGKLEYYYRQGTTGLYVSVAPPATPNATPARYTVWIDYDAAAHNLSVFVGGDGAPKPGQATLHAPVNISDIVPSYGGDYYFGLFASKNRLLPSCRPVIYSWNLTVDRLSTPKPKPGGLRIGVGWLLAIVLSLGLVAAVAAMALAGACSLASRYRALAMHLKLSRVLRRLPGVPREFRYADVKKASRNFHESMRLGRGGFGAVYKGTLQIVSATGDGEDGPRRRRHVDVAVKKFTRKEDRGYDDFLAEVAVINRLRHRNIVPLLGWCYENGKLLLIYQYMPNGSLDQHLFRENNRDQHRPTLRWETRYDVVRDVAAGLHYVHHEYERVVLHRDIKASNVMLDDALHGRLGDFGLARVVGLSRNSFTDVGVAGTWGFIAPEYAVSRRATRQTDVYAFGVLVLEVVTGRRSLGAADAPFPLLTDWVWWLHGEGRLLEAVDGELTAEAELDAADDATRLLLLGLACSNPKPSDRPSMAEVLQVIGKAMPPPHVPPAKPTFLWPPDGELDQLLKDSDDDFAGTGDGDSEWSHGEEAQSRGGIVISIGSLEITVGRSRKLRVT